MLNKLAFRNARRSSRDYIVYVLTMTVMAAMMFAFDSMALSPDILSMFREAGVMGAMIGLVSVFIVGILAWLIRYMTRFMLEKRSREFGTYLLLGMNKKQISGLYMKENILMGMIAFLMGIGVGMFLQQILMTIFYRVFGMDYPLHVQLNGWSMLMTSGIYILCYFFALIRNRRLFKKMTIAELMRMEKENEKIRESKSGFARIWFFVAVGFFIVYTILLFGERYSVAGVCCITVCFIAAVYLFYYGFSAILTSYIHKRKSGLYKPGRLFLLRQYTGKLGTMRFTMGTLTLLLMTAILGGSVSMMFARFQNQAIENSVPFDILVHSENPDDAFDEELAAIHDQCRTEDTWSYRIYQDGKQVMNEYLYTHGGTVSKKYRNPDGSLNEKAVEEDGYEYYSYDTYMRISDYNHLREMLGYEPVAFGQDKYAVQIKERMVPFLDDKIKARTLDTSLGELTLDEIYTIPFSQNGNNGADYLIIVPDEAAAGMDGYFSELAVSTEGKAPSDLQQTLETIRLKKNGIPTQEEFYEMQERGEIPEEAYWESETMGGFGTDQIVSCASDVLVREGIGMDLKLAMLSLVFPLAYVGLVFLCVALTIMSVQQLSDSSKYRFRYDVLSKLGMNEKEIDRLILKQLAFYYLVPVVIAVILSAATAVYAGHQFVFYTGANGSGMYYFGISLFIFAGVYLIYFGMTYLGFKRNVHYSA